MIDETQDLRTRIAAAIERSLVEQFPSDLPDRYGAWVKNDLLADAVIRELGLQRENDDEIPPFWPTQGEYRYVTEWTTDE